MDLIQIPHLLLMFDGCCEPTNPGGVSCSSWAVMQQGKSMRLALVEGSKVVATGGKLSTNNFAEYCGLGLGLKFLSETHWKGELTIMGDSQLVIRQVEGKWKRKNERIIELHARILQRLEELDLAKDGKIDENRCHLVWVPREENTYADRMTQKTYEQYTHKKFPVHRR